MKPEEIKEKFNEFLEAREVAKKKKEARREAELEKKEKEEEEKRKEDLEWMRKTQPNVYYKKGMWDSEFQTKWRRFKEIEEREKRGEADSGI